MGYGGDFGDEPNDYNFVMDGLLTSEHDVQSNIIEYAKAIEPVQTISTQQHSVTVVNRYDFLTLDHLVATWAIVTEGKEIGGGHVNIPSGKRTCTTNAKLTPVRNQASCHGHCHAGGLEGRDANGSAD